MNRDLQHIDDLFKSGLEGKEDSPSPAVWVNIEKELDKKDSRPKFLFWWNSRKIAAAALILLGSAGIFAGGYYLRGLRITEQESTSTSNPEAIKSGAKPNTQHTTPINDESKNTEQPATDMQTDASEPLTSPGTQISHDADALVLKTDQSRGRKKTSPENNKGNTLNTSTTIVNKPGSVSKINKPTQPGSISVEFKNKETSTVLPENKSDQPAELKKNDDWSANDNGAAKLWRPEQVLTYSETRPLPGTEKHLDVSQRAMDRAGNIISPASIPVLNKRNTKVDLPKFSFTPVVSWQFGSNRIVANSEYPDAGKVKAEIDRTESQPSQISGGLLADLRIAKNMTLQSGLILTSRTIRIEPKYIMAERNPDGKVRYKFDCSAGTYYLKKSTYARPGDSALTKFSTNELNYINIPLSLTYHFGGKKFHLFATAGAGLNVLTDQYLETGLSNYNYDEHESIATNLKSNYFNGTIGAGINWQAFRKMSFIFSPQYQFAISPMNENMPVKAYPRIFNMQLGMQIRL
jgi:hypothetical protein